MKIYKCNVRSKRLNLCFLSVLCTWKWWQKCAIEVRQRKVQKKKKKSKNGLGNGDDVPDKLAPGNLMNPTPLKLDTIEQPFNLNLPIFLYLKYKFHLDTYTFQFFFYITFPTKKSIKRKKKKKMIWRKDTTTKWELRKVSEHLDIQKWLCVCFISFNFFLFFILLKQKLVLSGCLFILYYLSHERKGVWIFGLS